MVQKVTKFTEGSVSIEIDTDGSLAFGTAFYLEGDVEELLELLDSPEVRAALGAAAKPTTTSLWPDTLMTQADVLLDWPEGTRLSDKQGDIWEKRNAVWTIVRWAYQTEDVLNYTHYNLAKYLPATVI